MITKFKIFESDSDIKINVEGKNSLVDKLISDLSLIVKKRKMKSLHIKSISGHINKEIFTKKGYSYETYLEITLTNKDTIIGEYKSSTNEIIIKINNDLIYDLNFKTFDNEVLIEKIVMEYIKYLKSKKFNINESMSGDKCIKIGQLFKDIEDKNDLKKALRDLIVGKMVTFYASREVFGSDNNEYTKKIKGVTPLYDVVIFIDDEGKQYYINIIYNIVIHDGEDEKPAKIRWYNKGKLE